MKNIFTRGVAYLGFSLCCSFSALASFVISPGEVTVHFLKKGNLSHIRIETPRLLLRPVISEDLENYAALYGDPQVMEKFATGKTRERDQVKNNIETWVKRIGEGDPFVSMAIFLKETNEFVGHVVLGHGDKPGQSAVDYLLNKKYWHQHLGSEALFAMIKKFAKKLYKRETKLEGEPFTEIVCCARLDNPASIKMIERVGFEKTGEKEKYGAMRSFYKLNVQSLLTPKVK
jgi:RimJ/RimL family protein N-acetyltransferase